MKIDTASAKIRTGPPVDDLEDYDLPVWAGIVPIEQRYGEPVQDPNSKNSYEVPFSVRQLLDN
jgi:hypothetical protein